ncbi:MAG TPA: VIT domain-containing protein [Thermoanaerobaculia bacterium]|nr:VIT domain-containing protein [Thermoanaerobaculia bacterium]
MSRTVTLLSLIVLAAVGLAAGFAHGPASPAKDSRPAAETMAAKATVPAPASFRFPKQSADRPAAEDAAPISLTASDGTGLALVALEANGLLEPPLAFTELHLTFENPRDQVIEGRFRIALPPGAALSRFAMKIGESWQEGEVVERQRARQAYEDFLHRRQDPALLEQEAGNEFSARVFPIPGRGRKELIVSFSHALPQAEEPYVLPLHGLSQIGQLDVRVLLGGRPAPDSEASNLGGQVSDVRLVELHKRDWTPDRDFEIGQDRLAGRAGLRHGNLTVVRVAAPVEAEPQEIAGLYVLIDSSASRALGYATQVQRLTELIGGLRDGAGAGTPVAIAAFDQEVVPIFEGTAGGFGEAEARRLRDRRPLGASNLQRALGWLGEKLKDGNARYPRVLLITDGVATAGDTETRALKASVKALGDIGVERLDVLAVGGLRDEAVLRELATGNLEHDGVRLDGAAPLAEIARRLTLASRSGIQVAVDGAGWVWPETLDGVQPGDEALVYADLPSNKPFHLSLGGRPVQLAGELAPIERPLLERAWVQARIERLLHLRETAHAGDDDLRKALGLEIAELSVKHRVLSPFTAMLVLETEWDYARFGLDRRALANILTVGPGGLEVRARTRPALPAQDAVAMKLRSLGDAARDQRRDIPAPEEVPAGNEATDALDVEEGVPGEVVGGVEGGVEGGVVGGVVGGVPGGVASGTVIPSPPRSAPATEAEPDDAPLRVGSLPPPPSSPPPIPAPERQRQEREEKTRWAAPYSGRFGEVMDHLAAGRIAQARTLAESWLAESPGDVLALLALGEVWEAAGEKTAAARAYGSLIDLFPSRADLRRLAGERLERLGGAGLELAIDTYQKAVLDRPDHPSGHRLLAWALLRAGRSADAFAALEQGLEQHYPGGRFAGVDQVMKEDLGLLGAAWLHAEPAKRTEILDRLHAHGARIESEPSLRFVLTWETDANDVDLHVYDRREGHAYYGAKELPSGGELIADVTTGYGPECFAVSDPADRDAAPYRLRVHYYRRGPMGYGMGTVQVVKHDGDGGLSIEPRPFVVMADDAMVDVGSVGAGKAVRGAGR